MIEFPKICESIYNTTKKNKQDFKIHNVINLILKNNNHHHNNDNKMKIN